VSLKKERYGIIVERAEDWEMTPDGLCRTTRAFLIRRRLCCGKRCGNCPYVNWCMDQNWEPLPAEYIRRVRGSRRSVAGAWALSAHHQAELAHASQSDYVYHQEMVRYYYQLLESWDR